MMNTYGKNDSQSQLELELESQSERNRTNLMEEVLFQAPTKENGRFKTKIKDKILRLFFLKKKQHVFIRKWTNISAVMTVLCSALIVFPFFDSWLVYTSHQEHSLSANIFFLTLIDILVSILLLMASVCILEASNIRFKWVRKMFFASSFSEEKEYTQLEAEITELVGIEQFQYEYITDTMFLIKQYQEKMHLSIANNLGKMIADMGAEHEKLIGCLANHDMTASLSVIYKIENLNEKISQQLSSCQKADNNKSLFLEKYQSYLEKNDLQDVFRNPVLNQPKDIQTELKNIL